MEACGWQLKQKVRFNIFLSEIIVLYGWKVNVQEQNEIVGELHIPRENFTFPRS